jgi:hypothetical protein
MIISLHSTSEQNKNIIIANEAFENVAKYKYLQTTVTNKNYIYDKKSRID